MSEVMGVILAAGAALRIRPLCENTPKPLLPVCNAPIVAHQLAQLREAGVERVIVVVGRMRDQFVEVLGDGSAHGVEIAYVDQLRPLGIAHALSLATPLIDAPFFVYLGDIFSAFAPGRGLSDLVAIREREGSVAVLTVAEEPDAEAIRRNFAVEQRDGRVTRVVEKPQGPLRTSLRGCGLYFFDPVALEAVARTPRSSLRDEYEITDSIAILVDSGAPVHCTSLIDWDANITYPVDLLDCNLRHLRALGVDAIVSKRARLHPDCVVSGSVIGDDVVIETPITISRSVVLAGTRVDSTDAIGDSVVGPDGIVECFSR